MPEIHSILELWRQAADRGEACLVATVVRVDGSSYRKAGARMLLTRGGQRAGTISGGCLEGEVAKKAWWLTEQGASVQQYASFYDEDSGDAYGLGCGGTVHVLLERAPAANAVLEALRLARLHRSGFASVSILSAPGHPELVGTQMVVGEQGLQLHAPSDPLLAVALANLAHGALETRQSAWHTLTVAGTSCEIFAEFLAPPIELLIFGAGDDAQPLVAYGHSLDWKVSVADGRSHLARAERFPEADAVYVVDLEDPLRGLPVTRDTFAVLMTHSYHQDRAFLRALLGRDLAYIGALGPKRRTAQLVRELSPEIGIAEDLCLERIHSPVGLDLGADTPASIALSIAAEIHASLRSRNATPLYRKAVTSEIDGPSTFIELPRA